MENTAKTRIPVVEDDQSVLSTIAMMLNLKGYEVETAYDGFDALMHLKDNIPDLMVSDLNMPQMSGFELLSVVRRRYPQIKVIATSGAYDPNDVPSGVICDGFYPKGRSSAAELLTHQRSTQSASKPFCKDRPGMDPAKWPGSQRQALRGAHLH